MKKFKILLFLALFSFLTTNAFASTIDKIEVVDNNTIQITASNDVVFSDSFVE
jgi:Skp family chaperone for outer membrane proteins